MFVHKTIDFFIKQCLFRYLTIVGKMICLLKNDICSQNNMFVHKTICFYRYLTIFLLKKDMFFKKNDMFVQNMICMFTKRYVCSQNDKFVHKTIYLKKTICS